MNQASRMIMDELWIGSQSDKPSEATQNSLKVVHDTLARELGLDWLSDRWWFSSNTWNGNTSRQSHEYTHAQICKNFLVAVPTSSDQIDRFLKDRISLIELAFQLRARQVNAANVNLPKELAEAEAKDKAASKFSNHPAAQGRVRYAQIKNEIMNKAFASSVAELNERMRLAQYPLDYHNGLIQFAQNKLTTDIVAKPFWALVAAPVWNSVDQQMKEAIDRRDRGDRTAPFHAVCALESTIKIISDTKGWTRGDEKGAASFIDNLVSQKNGRLIEVWESEALKTMFSDVRNPFAHGPGQSTLPSLSVQQTDWTIDTAMSWIKSLVRRI